MIRRIIISILVLASLVLQGCVSSPYEKHTDPAANSKLSQYQLSENTSMLFIDRTVSGYSQNYYDVSIDGKYVGSFYPQFPHNEYYAIALNPGWHDFVCYGPEGVMRSYRKKSKEEKKSLRFFIRAKTKKVISFSDCLDKNNYDSISNPAWLPTHPYQQPNYVAFNKYNSKLNKKRLIKFVSLVDTENWISSGMKAMYKKDVVNVDRAERLAAERKRLEEKIRKDTALAIKNTMERDGTKTLIYDAAKLAYYCDHLVKENVGIETFSCSYEDYTTTNLRVRTSNECISLKNEIYKKVEKDIKETCQLKFQLRDQLTQIYGEQSKGALEDVLADRQKNGNFRLKDDYPYADKLILRRLMNKVQEANVAKWDSVNQDYQTSWLGDVHAMLKGTTNSMSSTRNIFKQNQKMVNQTYKDIEHKSKNTNNHPYKKHYSISAFNKIKNKSDERKLNRINQEEACKAKGGRLDTRRNNCIVKNKAKAGEIKHLAINKTTSKKAEPCTSWGHVLQPGERVCFKASMLQYWCPKHQDKNKLGLLKYVQKIILKEDVSPKRCDHIDTQNSSPSSGQTID